MIDQRLFEKLRIIVLESSDVDLCPATDGGYHLIDLNIAEAVIFSNINWGTDTVLSNTIKKIVIKFRKDNTGKVLGLEVRLDNIIKEFDKNL